MMNVSRAKYDAVILEYNYNANIRHMIKTYFIFSYDKRYNSQLRVFIGPECITDCLSSMCEEAKTLLKVLRYTVNRIRICLL